METRTNAEQRMARTAMLLSENQIKILRNAHVMIFGLGGVGSYTAEALGRMGIGKLTIVDKDRFDATNINRQLCAMTSTAGKSKVAVTMQRLLDINPDAVVVPVEQFHLPETPVPIANDVSLVIDAVDTVAAKLLIIETCEKRGIPLISSMGMGNRLDPTQIKIGDIFDTSNCALSRVIRKELRKRGIGGLRCVYSTEKAIRILSEPPLKSGIKAVPGSVAYVPSVAGLLMAYEAIQILLNKLKTRDRC